MKVENIKNLLAQSEPHKYNFEYECGIDDYANLPPVERWITYIAADAEPKKGYFPDATINFASEAKKNYSGLADCDGSGIKGNNALIHAIYKTLFSWEKGKDTFGMVSEFQSFFGGETMNSLFFPMVDHAGAAINQIPKMPKMTRFSRNHLMDYFVQQETHDKFLAVLQNTYGLIDYINSYHTIGNFTLVPAKFNAFRGIKCGIRDYWDESLKYLKENGFSEVGFDKDEFTKYVNFFFLWDYIGENGEPKDLNPKYFLRQTTGYIYRRGVFMIAMLKLQKLLGERGYNELRNSVFCKSDWFYSGYSDVTDMLKSKISCNTEAEEILKKCLNEINVIC